MFSRHAVESTVDIRPPPIIDPDFHRRGSAPGVPLAAPGQPLASPIQRRPVTASQERPLPPNPPLNPTSTPVPRQLTSRPVPDQSMRSMLPRLIPPVQQTLVPQGSYGVPMSAPARTDNYSEAQSEIHGQMYGVQSAAPRLNGRTGIDEVSYVKEKDKRKKRINCVIM